MKRPRGITFVAVFFSLIGISWSVESIGLAVLAWNRWDLVGGSSAGTFILLWGTSALLLSIIFMFAGYGLWCLRYWARVTALGLAGLGSLIFLVGFLEWSYAPPSDISTRFQVLMESSQGMLLMPYALAAWPIRELAANFLLGDRAYRLDFYLRFLVGFVGYALIALYLLRSTRVKQAFSTAP